LCEVKEVVDESNDLVLLYLTSLQVYDSHFLRNVIKLWNSCTTAE